MESLRVFFCCCLKNIVSSYLKDFLQNTVILEYSFIIIVPLFCIITDENFAVFQHLYVFSPLPNRTSEVKVKLLSRVGLSETPWTIAYQAPPSMQY